MFDLEEVIKSRKEIARNESELVSILGKADLFLSNSLEPVLAIIREMIYCKDIEQAIHYMRSLPKDEDYYLIDVELNDDQFILSFFSKIEGTKQSYGVDLSIPFTELVSKTQVHLMGIYQHYKTSCYNFYARQIKEDLSLAIEKATVKNSRVENQNLLTTSGLSYKTMNMLDDYLNYLNDGFDIYQELKQQGRI